MCYPDEAELPVRLEFFGDTLEKTREFDLASSARSIRSRTVASTPHRVWPPGGRMPAASMPDGLEACFSPEALDQVGSKRHPRGCGG